MRGFFGPRAGGGSKGQSYGACKGCTRPCTHFAALKTTCQDLQHCDQRRDVQRDEASGSSFYKRDVNNIAPLPSFSSLQDIEAQLQRGQAACFVSWFLLSGWSADGFKARFQACRAFPDGPVAQNGAPGMSCAPGMWHVLWSRYSGTPIRIVDHRPCRRVGPLFWIGALT